MPHPSANRRVSSFRVAHQRARWFVVSCPTSQLSHRWARGEPRRHATPTTTGSRADGARRRRAGDPGPGRPVRGRETGTRALRAGGSAPHLGGAGGRRSRPVAGVPPSVAGQQVLLDHLLGRRTPAGLPRLPGRPAAAGPPPQPATPRRQRREDRQRREHRKRTVATGVDTTHGDRLGSGRADCRGLSLPRPADPDRQRWRRLQRVPRPAGPAGADGSGAGHRPAAPAARSVSTYHRLDPARCLPAVPRLRLLRRVAAAVLAGRALRARLQSAGRRVLQLRQRLLRHATRRGRLVHRVVHHLRRGAGAVRGRAVLRRAVGRGIPALAYRRRSDGGGLGLPARHRLRLRRGDDGEHRRGHLAAVAPRRLPAGAGRRHAGRGRCGRHPLPAHIGRGGVHHRRVPGRLVPPGAGLGNRADGALLPRHPARRGDRRSPLRRTPRGDRGRLTLASAGPVRLPLRLADRHHRVPRGRRVRDEGCRLRHPAHRRVVVPGPYPPAHPGPAGDSARHRRTRRPRRHRGLRRRRHHHGDHHEDRPRAAGGGAADRRGAGGHVGPDAGAGAHRAARRSGAHPARPGRAGHRVVRDRVGDRRSGPARPGRHRAGGGDVRLLLRGAVRGVPTDRTRRGGCRRGHRRPAGADHVADPAVRAAGVPDPCRVRHHAGRAGSARHRWCPADRLRGSGRRAQRGGARRRRRWLAARRGPRRPPERIIGAVAGVTLLWLEPVPVTVGATLAAVAAAGVFVRRRSAGRPSSGSPANPVEEQL